MNDLSIYTDPAAWEQLQRVAKAFSASALIPDHLRGKAADVVVALILARSLGDEPLLVMQSIYVVHGRPGWAASYVIGRANSSGVFRGPISWEESGDGEDLSVTAYATIAATGERASFTVSMAMAKADGWTKNPKYRTLPRLMLRYRSAVLLVRLYCPQVMMGYHTVEELHDVAEPVTAQPASLADALQIAESTIDAEPDTLTADAQPAHVADGGEE